MIFSGVLNPYKIGAEIPEGAPHIEIQADVGIQVPAGPNEMAIIPVGNVRLPIDKAAAEALGKRLVEIAAELPEPSKLEIASDLGAVEQAADQISRMRGNSHGR